MSRIVRHPGTGTSSREAVKTSKNKAKLYAATRSTGRWAMLCVAILLIVIAIVLLCVRIGLPWLSGYKGELESRLSEQMNSPVAIEKLSVSWEHFGPKLSAQGVSLGEKSDQQLSLDKVLIDMNLWHSATNKSFVFDELTLVGAKLALQTNADGRLELQGFKAPANASSSPGNGGEGLSWLMNTKRVGLQDATITLIDFSDQEELTISDLNIIATNDNSLHQLRIDMQLPDELGGEVEVGLDLVGDSSDIRNASADIHLKATDLKVDAWRSLRAARLDGLRLSTTGIARLDANMQLEIWGSIADGSLQTARGQLLATDVIDQNTQERVLDKVTTDIEFLKTDSGWQTSTDAVELTKGSDVTTVQDVLYEFNPEQGTAWRLNARGETLQLDVATPLTLSLFDDASRLPRARWLNKATPKGDLFDWDATFALVNGKPNFSLFSIYNNLELTATEGAPGIKNIGGIIDMENNIGEITMQGIDMQADLPSMYAKPLELEKFYGEFDLDIQDPLRTSLKGEVIIEDRGLNSSTRFEINLDPESSPHIDAQGKFTVDDLADANRYIPSRLLPAAAAQWFQQALVAGSVTNGEMLMFGHAADYPFKDNEGVFKIGLDFQDTSLDYLPGWPVALKAKGRVEMDGASVRATVSDGYIDDLRLSQLDMTIDNVKKPVVELSSTGAGTLPNMIEFARTGPLKETLGAAFADIEGEGRAQMDLELRIPLRASTSVASVANAQAKAQSSQLIPGLRVNGSIFLRNNTVTIAPAKLVLSEIDGAIGFSADSVRINNLQASVYGKPVRIDAQTEGQGVERAAKVTAIGPAPAIDVLENYEIPLTQFVDGTSLWNTTVSLPMSNAGLERDGIVVAAVSSLVGTRLDLPAPLGKSRASGKRLAVSTRIDPDSPDSEWIVDYADTLRSFIRVNDEGMQSFSGRFGGGAANAEVYDGIRLDGVADAFVLDAWVESISDFLDGLEESEAPEPILPISADVSVNQFIVGTEAVGGGRLRFNTDSEYINGKIDSPWLNATVRYPRVHWKQDLPIDMRVMSVDKRIIDALDSAPPSAPSDELDPRTLPPINIQVNQIQWDQMTLEGLKIRTSPSAEGLKIDTVEMTYPTAQLVGEGYWHLREPNAPNALFADQHVTRLNMSLKIRDFGVLLTDVGFDGILAEGQGEVEGPLQWSGPGYKPALEDFVGQMDVDIEKGRILTVEPGAARMAGLFAFQSIPRRLSLDFKDLVLDGLDYETVRGTVQLANGIAHTPLMQLNGAVGVVDITGESNLVNEEYNQRLTVLPRVGAALPIIAIISGGATAGVGALLAGGFLKAIGIDFDRLGLRYYTLTGSWDAPELNAATSQAFSQ